MNALRTLYELIFPPKCPFCGKVLEKWEGGICALCGKSLPRTAPEDIRQIEGCCVCLSPLWYRDGVVNAVHRCKFQGARGYAGVLGGLMADCLTERRQEPADLITWAPLSAKRRKKRGYDQAELLARRVGELTGIPALPALEKTRQAGVQSRIGDDEARRANVSGVYRVLPGADIKGKRIVLVDDIVTSGATLAECAACLRDAGAGSVVALTLARAR